MHNKSIPRRCVRLLRSFMGQKSFYRVIRMLMYEARFDVLNDPATNGERYVQAVVLGYFDNPVVSDVGANVGDWTEALLSQAGSRNVVVHAFEPCKGTFEMLQKRYGSRKGVSLVQMACSDQTGVGNLAVDAPGSGINSLVGQGMSDAEEVALTTIDVYSREHSIPHIHLLKVDAEGHDLSILIGAQHMLQAHAIDIVQFEYNFRWIAPRRLLRDAFEYLQPLGYCVGKVTGDAVQFYSKWHWELETYREGNYIACLPEAKKLFRVVPADWVPQA